MILSYNQERCLVKGILTAAGYSVEDADTIGTVITHSDFTGVYSHGLSRLTRYLRQIKVGALNPHPDMQKLLDEGAVLVFDGDNGSGIVTVNRAYEDAAKKAREFGISFVTARHNANIGCGSYYGWRAAEDNLICICGCNTYAFTSPFGGADRLIGTNPIIVAVPTDKEYPMVMDISTTFVAMGKIQAAEREGQAIPFARLANIVINPDIGLFSKLEPENTGYFMILIDPAKFMPIEEFKQNADRYIRMMKDSRKAPGVNEIFLPGEIEYRKFKENKEKGMSFSPALEKELTELSVQLGAIAEGASFEEMVHQFEAQG